MLMNPLAWSLPIGRFFGITVRVHLLFVLVGLGAIGYHALGKGPDAPKPGEWIDMTIIIAILFVSVLLHEFGHCFGARWVDGDAQEILLWPLGGLASTEVPHSARAHFITTACGPAVNVILCLLSGVILVSVCHWYPPFYPFAAPVRVVGEGSIGMLNLTPVAGAEPLGFRSVDVILGTATATLNVTTTPWVILTAWVFWVNWILFLFNMILVAYPLDGGRLLQATLWRYVGYRQATLTAVFAGFVTAAAVILYSFVMNSSMAVALALFIFVFCRQEYMVLEMGAEDGVFGYDFSQGYTSLERDQSAPGTSTPPPRRKQSWWQRWRQSRAAKKMQRELEVREAEERRMDELLEKVQREGMNALNDEERRFLKRVSDRYRNRQ